MEKGTFSLHLNKFHIINEKDREIAQLKMKEKEAGKAQRHKLQVPTKQD